MNHSIITKLSNKLKPQDNLTKKIVKNIKYSLVLKIFSVLLSFYSVKVAYSFIDSQAIYGLWLTILSVLNWLALLNGGLSNTLRNKLSNAIEKKDFILSKRLISSAYFSMLIISIIVCLFLISITFIFDFRNIFSSFFIDRYVFTFIILVLVISFLIQLILSIVNAICYAMNIAVLPSFFTFCSSAFFVIQLLVFKYFNMQGIIYLAISYSISIIVIMFVANIVLFKKNFKFIKPEVKYIEVKVMNELFSTSIKFFMLEISAVMLFSTDSILIAKLVNTEEVTVYQLIMKILSVFTILSSTIITPMWSAVATAYINEDTKWIKNKLKKIVYLLVPLLTVLLLVTLFAENIIHIWVDDQIKIDMLLAFVIAAFIFQNIWCNIFAYFLNGIGKITAQLCLVLTGAILNIPLSILFVQYFEMGSKGIVLSSIICLMPFSIYGPIEILRLLNKKDVNNENRIYK